MAERPVVLPPDRPEERAMNSREENLFLLAYIEKHIIEGNDHIRTMRRLIAAGEQLRSDMTEAKGRLGQFMSTQAHRQAHRERVLRELDQLSGQ